MQAGTIPHPALLALVGITITHVEPGHVVFEATARDDVYNGLGVAHGGFAATLLDSALGCSINTMVPPGRVFTTLELKVNYLRPLRAEMGVLRCEGRAIHVGSRTGVSEARIIDAGGRTCAHGTTTCIAIDDR